MRGLKTILAWGALGGGLVLGLSACVTAHSDDKMMAMTPMTPVAHGRELVRNYVSCGSCHRMTLPATETPLQLRRPGTRGPDLGRLPAATIEATLTPILEQGQSPNGMPVFHLPHQDAQDVIAYLKTLSASAGPAAGGGGGSPAPAAGGRRGGDEREGGDR